MTTAIQADPPPAQKLPALLGQRTTYLLIPHDEHETRIARHWISNKYGEDFKAQVVRGVPLIRLTEQHTIIVIARRRIKAITRRQLGAGGMPEDFEIDLDELAVEVVEREPLKIATLWRDDNEETGGSIDLENFWPALNKRSAPFHCQFRADEGIVRLGQL